MRAAAPAPEAGRNRERHGLKAGTATAGFPHANRALPRISRRLPGAGMAADSNHRSLKE